MTSGRDGFLLRVELHDWDNCRVGAGSAIRLDEEHYRVRSVTCCPGGEPEAWVWLHRIERPVENDFPYDHPLPTTGVVVGRQRWSRVDNPACPWDDIPHECYFYSVSSVRFTPGRVRTKSGPNAIAGVRKPGRTAPSRTRTTAARDASTVRS